MLRIRADIKHRASKPSSLSAKPTVWEGFEESVTFCCTLGQDSPLRTRDGNLIHKQSTQFENRAQIGGFQNHMRFPKRGMIRNWLIVKNASQHIGNPYESVCVFVTTASMMLYIYDKRLQIRGYPRGLEYRTDQKLTLTKMKLCTPAFGRRGQPVRMPPLVINSWRYSKVPDLESSFHIWPGPRGFHFRLHLYGYHTSTSLQTYSKYDASRRWYLISYSACCIRRTYISWLHYYTAVVVYIAYLLTL